MLVSPAMLAMISSYTGDGTTEDGSHVSYSGRRHRYMYEPRILTILGHFLDRHATYCHTMNLRLVTP